MLARRCDLTGKGVQTGNNVSHANNKTRRRFIPNLQKISLLSDVLRRSISMRLCVSAIRSVEKNGGLDAYLLRAKDTQLSSSAIKLKNQIKKIKIAKI